MVKGRFRAPEYRTGHMSGVQIRPEYRRVHMSGPDDVWLKGSSGLLNTGLSTCQGSRLGRKVHMSGPDDVMVKGRFRAPEYRTVHMSGPVRFPV